jgi:hypothetical protein
MFAPVNRRPQVILVKLPLFTVLTQSGLTLIIENIYRNNDARAGMQSFYFILILFCVENYQDLIERQRLPASKLQKRESSSGHCSEG